MFEYNSFKANASKCHFVIIKMPFFLITVSTHFNKHGCIIKSNNWRRLLGFSINSGFTFEEHINTLCWKEQKLYDLSRVSQYLSQHKSRSHSTSQFNFCCLFWMCQKRGLNNKINNTHKRALRIVYQKKKNNQIYEMYCRKTNGHIEIEKP